MKPTLFCLLFIFLSLESIAQRTLPNPIILVHGWTGSDLDWSEFSNFLEQNVGLSVERNSLNFDLNFDQNLKTSYLYNDIHDYTNNLGNKDIYIINFNIGLNKSNQSAIVKQGYALGRAISNVLLASGSNKVTLLGHSMGGLAIREYLQNSSNWLFDGQHHVAKIATVGTPHKGSNFSGWNLGYIFGYDENSEAVRDLKESYSFSSCQRNGVPIPCPGVYLWGGQETKTWMKTNAFGDSRFYNRDVNCNNVTEESVTGLNQKSIRTDLDFSCVIGGPNNDDGIVTVESQNINNVYNVGADVYYFSCASSFPYQCHSDEPKKAFKEMLQALDEPKKILTTIKFGQSIKGIQTQQMSGSLQDKDDYQIFVSQRGVISYNAGSVSGSDSKIIVLDPYGNSISFENIGSSSSKSFEVNSAGTYTISITGNTVGLASTYVFSFGFCPLPSIPNISALSPVEFCEGEAVTLTTTSGYESYTWFKDGIAYSKGNNLLTVKEKGNFIVQASKCNILTNSLNSISTNVKPNPPKPEIKNDVQPNQFVLSSSSSENNQWFLNDKMIPSATSATYIPTELGQYTVKVTTNGCSNISEKVSVSMEKPILNLNGIQNLCNGDSIKVIAPTGYSNYIFSDG